MINDSNNKVMAKRVIMILLMTGLSALVYADGSLSQFINKLRKEHVTTIIVYNVVQPEARSIISDDEHDLPIENTYVIWFNHGNWNILSIHPMSYIPICINASSLNAYLRRNIKKMSHEVIKSSYIYDSDDIIRHVDIYYNSAHLSYEFNSNALSSENNSHHYLNNRRLKRINFVRVLIKVIKSSSLDSSLKRGLLPLWKYN